ncbi:MAG: hypothetical protein WBP13_04310 [Methylophilaceae bacterium]
MKIEFFARSLLTLILLISLSACQEEGEPTEIPDEASTALYDAIQSELKAETLNQEGKYAKALALTDQFLAQHGKSADPNVQAEIAKAMQQKGVALMGLNHTDKAIQAYDALLKRFDDAKLIELQEQVAMAMINKAYSFYDLKNSADETKAYDAVISRFASSKDSRLLEQVAVAQNNKGYSQILQAKQAWGDVNARNMLLNQALSAIELAVKAQSRDTRTMALGNMAYTKWLLGRTDEAKSPLKEALKLGGEWLYNGEIEDTKKFTVPVDVGFIALLNKAWEESQPKVKLKKDQKEGDTTNENNSNDENNDGSLIHV